MPRFVLEGPRPCTIFYFALIHYEWVTSLKRFYWLVPRTVVNYGGTPPHDKPVNTTTSLLRPLYSGPKKRAQSVIFLFKQPIRYDHPVNATNFPWLEGGRIKGVPLYSCFVHHQDRKTEQKHTAKNFVEFHNHPPPLLWTDILVSKNANFQWITLRKHGYHRKLKAWFALDKTAGTSCNRPLFQSQHGTLFPALLHSRSG